VNKDADLTFTYRWFGTPCLPSGSCSEINAAMGSALRQAALGAESSELKTLLDNGYDVALTLKSYPKTGY
jgi:hypothetical protein